MKWLLLLTGLFCQGAYPGGDYWTRASFVEKIVLLTEWPQYGLGNASKEFVIKVLGRDEFTRSLEKYYSNHKILNRTVVILPIRSIDEAGNCQILYFPKAYNSSHVAIIQTTRKGILTLSNTPGFGLKGVMINFIDKGNEVGFEINRKSMQNAGFKISSQLLRAGKTLN
jgi:hypothetical protein